MWDGRSGQDNNSGGSLQISNAEKKFDKIVMVVVSQTPNVTKIQEVASKLGLNLESRNKLERGSTLRERIKM